MLQFKIKLPNLSYKSKHDFNLKMLLYARAALWRSIACCWQGPQAKLHLHRQLRVSLRFIATLHFFLDEVFCTSAFIGFSTNHIKWNRGLVNVDKFTLFSVSLVSRSENLAWNYWIESLKSTRMTLIHFFPYRYSFTPGKSTKPVIRELEHNFRVKTIPNLTSTERKPSSFYTVHFLTQF